MLLEHGRVPARIILRDGLHFDTGSQPRGFMGFGNNLYAAVATMGLLARFANLKLPGELDVLTSWWVIGVALFMFVVEFVADKIPVVDSNWDVIHTMCGITPPLARFEAKTI